MIFFLEEKNKMAIALYESVFKNLTENINKEIKTYSKLPSFRNFLSIQRRKKKQQHFTETSQLTAVLQDLNSMSIWRLKLNFKVIVSLIKEIKFL